MKLNNLKFCLKGFIAIVLCVAMIFSAMPVSAKTRQKSYVSLYNEEKVSAEIFADNGEYKKDYPNGLVMFPVVTAELKMDNFYAIDIYRMGGTEGEATVTVETVDYTAGYGTDYEIYLTNEYGEAPVDGEAALLYAMEEFSFIPVITSGESQVDDESDTSADDVLSSFTDEFQDLITPSSSFSLTFASGESKKKIYIKTIKDDTVTDDLEFIVNLKDAQGCEIGAQNSAGFTIKEEREKPETQLKIVDTQVNPDSEQAYVIVARGGNLGTYGSYRVVTQSDTAVAGEDYEAVQMQLDFVPGMSEQKIPINILDEAENGEEFTVLLENVKNATALNTSATVTFTDKIRVEEKHETAMTGAYSPSKSESREYEYVPISQFQVSTKTDRGAGKQKSSFTQNATYGELYYSNGGASKNNAISVRTKDKINFSGVDKLSMVIDNYTGSCSWDHNAIYIADIDKFSSNTGDYDWLDSLDDDGVGASWNMTNVADGHIVRTTGNLDKSKIKGEHYLYVMMHKGAFAGNCSFKIFSDGSTTDNILMHLTKYNISIDEPDNVQIYKNGVLDTIKPASNMKITDPLDGSFTTSTTIYRNESVAISGVPADGLGSHVRLKGIVFVDSGNTSLESELVSLSNDSFTLTPELIDKYSSYFDNNKIIIKPVYSVDTATIEVGVYSNSDGQKLVKNDDGYSAIVYNENKEIGTISWTESERSNKSYSVGDEIKFTFTPNESTGNWCISITVQSGTSASNAAGNGISTFVSTENTITYTATDLFTKITPYVSSVDPNVVVNITNPLCGSIVGDTSGFTTENDDGSETISGYKLSDGRKVDFDDLSFGSVLSVYAEPDDGYRAKWICNDSITGEEKTYYGNSFFFAVQYALDADDNNITLTFEEIDSSKQKPYYINGTVSIQEGSILSPPNLETDIYEIVPNASVTIGNYMGLSDENGEFYLETEPTQSTSNKASVMLADDETIRALVMCNNQYYITDVKVGDYITEDKTDKTDATDATDTTDTTETLSFDLKLDYKTNGPVPKSITATDNGNNTYGDTIPLVTAKSIQFDLYLDLTQQDSERPINMVKWTIESEDGVNYQEEIELEDGSSKSHFATILSEIARPGMFLYVELFNVSTNSAAEKVYTTFGKFDTGYNFISTAVEESVTYAPDIGVPSTMALPAPCIGPINPTCSLKGFTPVFNVGESGTDSQGREMKTVTIGLSFAALKNYASADPKFTTSSPLDKGKMLGNMLGNFDECYNKTGGLPAFAGGKGIESALNMKTALKLNISVALCYQGNYYVDEETGDWMFVSHIVILGFGGSFSVSFPFTFFYIPCFTYITIALNTNIYIGIFPKTDSETGSTVALTLTQLDDAELSEIQGVYEIKGAITFGLGIGFDGIVSASGSITTNVDIQFNDFMRGVGNLGMSGGVTLELLFFKYTWSESFLNVELFNTLSDNPYSLRSVSSAFSEDLMNKVTLGDMSLETATENNSFLVGAELVKGECIAADSNTLVSPSVSSIGNGRYIITTIITVEENGETKHKLYYFIYDEPTAKIIEHGFVLDKYISDMQARNSRSGLTSQQADYLDSDVQMTDCGEDILITWTKLNRKVTENTDNLMLMKSVGIACVYYNKEKGTFHDYSMTVSDDENEIYINPKVAYNSETGLTQMFYEKMDISDISLDTTISEFQETPTVLATRFIDTNKSVTDWSEENVIALSENALNYYTVESVNDKIVLAFVGSGKKGFTLEDISGFEYDDSFDDSMFNTENSLYIQQFSLDGDNLTESQQVRITGDNYVSANPEFAHINTGGVNNLLLFYKCNGLYAYQNINTLITQGIYTDENGNLKLLEDYMEPQFITDDEDYTVNDDFMIVSNDELIYALWTTTEGTQQQIWARSFCIDGIETVEGTIVKDSDGNATYDADGNVVIDKYDEPVHLLKGHWGGKTYLTEDGVGGTSKGMYKKNFDAVVMDDGNLLTVFNAYDMDYSNEEIGIENNRVVIAEYYTSSEYVLTDAVDDLMFSNSYPTAGEAIKVESLIKNEGVLNGEDVTAELYVNGEKYAENTYEHWLTAESKRVEFEYIVPENIKAEDVQMCVKIVENGETKLTTDTYSLKSDNSLTIKNLSFVPVKNASNDDDTTAYRVIAEIENTGNQDYTSGKYFRVMETDMKNLTASMNEDNAEENLDIYTMYGTSEIPEIKVGERKIVSFITDEIPKSAFEKNAGGVSAYLEGIITDGSQLDKVVFGANDEMTIFNQLFPGMTMLAQEKDVERISLSDLTLVSGNSAKLKKEIYPLSSQLNTEIKYTSSDESVATVDNMGVVTALKSGSCTITAEANGVKSTATVTVTEKATEEPTEKPSQPSETGETNSKETESATQKASKIETTETSENKAPSPVTGDSSNLILWFVLAAISLTTAIAVLSYRKKKDE